MSEGDTPGLAPTDTVVRMPKLADTLVEGTVGQWLKQVGDTVGRGEPLASIETDKVTSELTSPAAGTLLELLVAAGSTVPIETPIARIGDPAALAPAAPAGPPPISQAPDVPSPASPSSPPLPGFPASPASRSSPPAAAESRTSALPVSPRPASKATPLAARLLLEHGLTVDQVPAHSGRLTRDDVLAFVQAQGGPRTRHSVPPGEGQGEGAPASARRHGPERESEATPRANGELIPLTPMRRAIAEHMTRSRQTIPHGQTVIDADLTQLVAWRDQHKAAFLTTEGASLTFTVLFVRALAHSLAAHTRASVDIGVAVAFDGGLIVPVLRAADSLSLAQTARGVADLAQRARANKLTLEDTQGATMTVTNVGSFGNLTASPIIPLAQLGILGPGLVERRPLPGPNGAIRAGWRCLLSLVFDRQQTPDLAADRLLRATVTTLIHLPTDSELPVPLAANP